MSKRLLAALAEVEAPAPAGDDLAELNVTPFSELQPIPRYLAPSQVEFAREFNKRLVVDPAKYEEYADLWRAGVDLAARDPMVVFFIIEQQRYVVIDCWHRLQGWVLAFGDKPLQFAVVEGTEAQAHAAALGANPGHGIPRSNDDKVKVVKEALERYTRPSGRLSDQLVARICGVSAAMVGKWRQRLEAAAIIPATDNVTTGNGRVMQTASIGNKPAPGATFVAPAASPATNGSGGAALHSTEATVTRQDATPAPSFTPVATPAPDLLKPAIEISLDTPFTIGETSFLLVMGGEYVSITNEASADGAEVVVPLADLWGAVVALSKTPAVKALGIKPTA